jgi:hypothetical protein
MANDWIREAAVIESWSMPGFAETIGVDVDNAECWITEERTPIHRLESQ